MRREFAEVGDGRIEDYDLRLVDADGFLDADGSQWVGLSEIGADHHHGFGRSSLPSRWAHGRHPGHAWRPARNSCDHNERCCPDCWSGMPPA